MGAFRGSRSSSNEIQVRSSRRSFHRETRGHAASRRSPRTDRPSRKRETARKRKITRVGARSRPDRFAHRWTQADRTTTPFHRSHASFLLSRFLARGERRGPTRISFDSWHNVVSSTRPLTVAVKAYRHLVDRRVAAIRVALVPPETRN